MEIIHLVLGKANPERMNGVNKVVYQLATQQVAHGYPVSVWGITRDLTENYGSRTFNTRLFPASRFPFGVSRELRQAIAEKKGKAIFHLHGGWIPVFYALSRILHQQGIPHILTPHGAYNTIAMQRSAWMKRLYFLLFERTLLQQVRTVHCIGASEVTGLLNIFPNDKAKLIPYGFDSSGLSPDKSASTPGMFVVGFVGRLDIYTKGLDLLLDAFADFIQHQPQAQLWIVGGGEETKLATMIIDRNLHDHVLLYGSKFGVEKEALMRQMHVFAHPSRNEGLPASVLEASAMAIPCIVTEATNVASYIASYAGGRVVTDGHVHELTRAIEDLYSLHIQGELQPLGRNARRMVQEVFNWNRIVHDFNLLYQV